MKNYIQKGENLTLAAPYAVSSGDGVQTGLIFGVAAGDAASGATVDLVTEGVFDLPKVSTDTFAIGAAAYWDDTAKLITSDDDTGGNPKIGVTIAAAANPSGSVAVRLNGAF